MEEKKRGEKCVEKSVERVEKSFLE